MQTQVIEVALGVFAAFFIVALIASAVVEIISGLMKKRSKDLDIVLTEMLTAGGTTAINLRDTSVYKSFEAASRRKRGIGNDKRKPSYLSARSFADGVIEGLITLKDGKKNIGEVVTALPDGTFKKRLTTLQTEFDDDLVQIKAGLEGWLNRPVFCIRSGLAWGLDVRSGFERSRGSRTRRAGCRRARCAADGC